VGEFDAQGNPKEVARPVIEASPAQTKKKHNSLLGDFTLYKVNKEFVNF